MDDLSKTRKKTRWGDIFNNYLSQGCDYADAAFRADEWEKLNSRRNKQTDMPQSDVYEISVIEAKINKIKQRLFWYENRPDDDRVVEMVDQLRAYRKQLIELNENPANYI